jgi:hypothetical protein
LAPANINAIAVHGSVTSQMRPYLLPDHVFTYNILFFEKSNARSGERPLQQKVAENVGAIGLAVSA